MSIDALRRGLYVVAVVAWLGFFCGYAAAFELGNDTTDLFGILLSQQSQESADQLQDMPRGVLLAQVYGAILPEELRVGIVNFFYNIRFPVRFINCLLQGKGTKAGQEAGRFSSIPCGAFWAWAMWRRSFRACNPAGRTWGKPLRYGDSVSGTISCCRF